VPSFTNAVLSFTIYIYIVAAGDAVALDLVLTASL
jgi:hypothetical protein